MSRWTKCDNCGKLQIEPYRLAPDERAEAWEARADQVSISLEHNEDAKSFDACSWACVAEIALRMAAETAAADNTSGREDER